MKILIGTPIHICKDYSMERWLKSVSEFTYPHDFMMVDNSPDESYMEKVKRYCAKYGITNYKLVHVDVDQKLGTDGKLSFAREAIRQEVLAKRYDAWCTLECDIIAPPNALDELVRLISDCMEINHSYPSRVNPREMMSGFGLSLVKKEALEKYGFIGQYAYCDPEMPDCFQGGESWFITRLIRNGGSCIDVSGVIKPIFHLDK